MVIFIKVIITFRINSFKILIMLYIIEETLQLHEDIVAFNDVALSQPNNVNAFENLALHSIEIQSDDTSCQLLTKNYRKQDQARKI